MAKARGDGAVTRKVGKIARPGGSKSGVKTVVTKVGSTGGEKNIKRSIDKSPVTKADESR